MAKSISFGTGGILLLTAGAYATHSVSADISQFLSGSLTSKSVWIMIAGLVLLVIGIMEALKRAPRGWWDGLNSPLAFLVIALFAGLSGFSSDTSLTTSIAGVFFIVSIVLFLVSLLQSSRR